MKTTKFIKTLLAQHPTISPYGKRRHRSFYADVENYLTWYFTGAHPPPALTDPLAQWPGDKGPLYTVLNGGYFNNFLHQHGNLAFKQQQICRHIAHYIAWQTTDFPATQVSKTIFNISFSNILTNGGPRILLVAQRRSRVRYWLRAINQCATIPGQRGYLQDVLLAETDWNTHHAIGALWEEGGASLQKIWCDPLLGTGLKQFLTKEAANTTANMINYQTVNRHYTKPQLPILKHHLQKFVNLQYQMNWLRNAPIKPNDQIFQLEYAMNERTYTQKSIENLLGVSLTDDQIYKMATDQTSEMLQRFRQFDFDQCKDDLPYLLALHESIIKINAEHCLSLVARVVDYAAGGQPGKLLSRKYWAAFSFCIPVICTHIADLPSLMAKIRNSYLPLVIIDQQDERYAPESLLPCINMARNTLYLSGE